MIRRYQLTGGRHKPARVLDTVRGDVNKFIKREREKPLPAGKDFWDFECAFGKNADEMKPSHVKTLAKDIDIAADENWDSILVELTPQSRARQKKD